MKEKCPEINISSFTNSQKQIPIIPTIKFSIIKASTSLHIRVSQSIFPAVNYGSIGVNYRSIYHAKSLMKSRTLGRLNQLNLLNIFEQKYNLSFRREKFYRQRRRNSCQQGQCSLEQGRMQDWRGAEQECSGNYKSRSCSHLDHERTVDPPPRLLLSPQQSRIQCSLPPVAGL